MAGTACTADVSPADLVSAPTCSTHRRSGERGWTGARCDFCQEFNEVGRMTTMQRLLVMSLVLLRCKRWTLEWAANCHDSSDSIHPGGSANVGQACCASLDACCC